jgi:hypothetical protein
MRAEAWRLESSALHCAQMLTSLMRQQPMVKKF